MAAALSVTELRVIVGDKTILAIDSLSLEPGEVLAVVGPNGAGKSTLLQVLGLLREPDTGVVRMDGQVIGNGNRLAARRRLAMVFQDALLLDMSVRNNIEIPLRIRGISRKEASVEARKWMERMGILHLARQRARSLSGGEAQRTSLARALALNPEILLMDEPFSALDYPTRNTLLSDIAGILHTSGMTAVFVTHDFSEIPALTREVAVLYEGKIVKKGEIHAILGEQAVSARNWAPWDDRPAPG
jgi:tungstate transport system ATP-binding protein